MTKKIRIKNLPIGGGAPISVQSMTNVSVCDVDSTLRQINDLQNSDCDIVRIALPDNKAAEAFSIVRKNTDMPLVADIHFDGRLAVAAIEAGADKIRINPGNMSFKQLDSVIDCAKSNGIPIRLGVNGGSVNRDLLKMHNGDKVLAIEANLRQYITYFEDKGFDKIVLSVKSSDVSEMVRVNRSIAASFDYPIHLGVTEAGPAYQGLVKNSVGIGTLLLDGIGDTIRVSLTANPVEEVRAAKEILKSLNLRDGVKFVSCPKCGRCGYDLEKAATEIYEYVKDMRKNIKVAVMGCEVNGPGECLDADVGIAGANGRCVFFKYGKIYKTVDESVAVEEFKREIDLIAK